MKSSDRTILIALALLGALAAAWFLLLAPKRDQVAKLDDEISSVRASLEQQQQLVAAAEEARDEYHRDYSDLVVLGKAVPGEEDTSSLFVELEALAGRSGTQFDSIKLEAASSDAPPPPPASETDTDTDSATPPAAAASTPVATEAAAALMPIGATVGPAGLPVMPYSITLSGNFFQIADFLAGVDRLVGTDKAGPVADGRLITVNGFELTPNELAGSDALAASLSVTTYVSPADQGVTAGATPSAPAPATSTATSAVPTSAGVATP